MPPEAQSRPRLLWVTGSLIPSGPSLAARTRSLRAGLAALPWWVQVLAVYGAARAAFWNPQTSTFRILLPLFPLALAAVLLSRSRAYRWLWIAFCGCLQVVWVSWLWAWLPLFGGGDYSP